VIRHDWRRVAIACAAALAATLFAAARPAAARPQIPANVYLDKALGMWFGELIGNYAGKGCVPGTTTNREGYVVRGGAYFDIGWNNILATTTWVGDDDTCFEYMYVSLLGQGPSPTAGQIRQAWVDNIPTPAGLVYIANRQARWLMDPPPTGKSLSPPETGFFRNNMHAAAIDAQITTESLGSLVPGLRQRAADLSGTFAGVSNEGFSVHAAQFYAAMYADAAMQSDVPTVINDALAVVPRSSRTYEVISAVQAFHQANPADWRACQTMLYDNYGSTAGSNGRYLVWVESTVNVGLTTMALLYGNGSFQQTVDIAVLGGYDADCNPATAAGLLGMIKGYQGLGGSGGGILAELPATPSGAYDVQCLTSIGTATTTSQVAQLFAAAAEMQIVAAGGSVVGTGDQRVYVLPDDVVAAPPERPNPAGPAGLVGQVQAAGMTVSVSASMARYIPAQDRNNLAAIIDGITDVSYNGHRPYWTNDGDNPQPAGGDWYQLTFPRDMTFNKVVYYEGDIVYSGINANPRQTMPYGGFFKDLTVEVLRDAKWQAVSGLTFSEPLDPNAYYQTIAMTFEPIAASAVRIRGDAGGSQQFTTIVELEAYGRMGVAGDCNEDGQLDHGDLVSLTSHFGQQGNWADGDFNFDGVVDAADYAAMKRSWLDAQPGTFQAGGLAPEPASALFLLGGLARLLPRRRPIVLK